MEHWYLSHCTEARIPKARGTQEHEIWVDVPEGGTKRVCRRTPPKFLRPYSRPPQRAVPAFCRQRRVSLVPVSVTDYDNMAAADVAGAAPEANNRLYGELVPRQIPAIWGKANSFAACCGRERSSKHAGPGHTFSASAAAIVASTSLSPVPPSLSHTFSDQPELVAGQPLPAGGTLTSGAFGTM
jgi:hypothetical protein